MLSVGWEAGPGWSQMWFRECSPTGPAKGIYDGRSITNSRPSSSPVRAILLFHFFSLPLFFFLTELPGFPHSLACAFIPLGGSSIVLIERTFCQILQRMRVARRNTVSAAVPQRCQQNKLKLKCVIFAPLASPLAFQTVFPKPSRSPVFHLSFFGHSEPHPRIIGLSIFL